MTETSSGVSFECVNVDCSQEVEVSFGFDELPGWALCGCGYGYLVDRSREWVRAVDDAGMVHQFDGDEIMMHIRISVTERSVASDRIQGKVTTKEARNALLSEVSEKGAVTVEKIPLPFELLEEELDLPEVLVLKVGSEMAPPALREISEYYAEEIEKVKVEFEA